jgi:hypothetical protein
MIKFMNFCNISVRWRSRYGVWPIAIPCFTVSTYHIPYVASFLCISTSLPRSVEDWSLISPTEPNHSFNLSSTTVSSRTCYCSSISFVLAIFSLKLLIQNFTLMKTSLTMFHSSFDCSISFTDRICIILRLSRILID